MAPSYSDTGGLKVMYGHHIYCSKGKDQPGKVANSTRGELNRENSSGGLITFSPVALARQR